MRFSDAATLVAVGVVVLLVSLPRLREFALRENEEDARVLVERLAGLAAREVRAAESGNVATLLSADPAVARLIDDAEFLERGARMRRHGYLFEVGPAADGSLVRAWPWLHRKTGFSAYAWTPGQRLVAHPNESGEWSGLAARPELAADSGWRDLDEGR